MMGLLNNAITIDWWLAEGSLCSRDCPSAHESSLFSNASVMHSTKPFLLDVSSSMISSLSTLISLALFIPVA
nr:hypothetical transcript [Hymenolepis microstoma]